MGSEQFTRNKQYFVDRLPHAAFSRAKDTSPDSLGK
jgi:hypothetical protein